MKINYIITIILITSATAIVVNTYHSESESNINNSEYDIKIISHQSNINSINKSKIIEDNTSSYSEKTSEYYSEINDKKPENIEQYDETIYSKNIYANDKWGDSAQASNEANNISTSYALTKVDNKTQNKYSDTQYPAPAPQVYDTFGNLIEVDSDSQQTYAAIDTVYDEYGNLVENTPARMECPDSLYMGGSAYSVNILKRAGCPKPKNHQGEW